ncbi:MAG: helix-turn-helix transcriptional regulator [Ardenticatenales bacterium]|nr:helix-turn-helix transcriptional regulator [Ardenticatenales bacterium]MCB9553505.1 helix-turn-helix transcriptional regulator [Myxococcales bacterium]
MAQRDLAAAAGIRPPHLSRIEAGKAWPSLDLLLALGAALDLHPGALLMLDGDGLRLADLMRSITEGLQTELPHK